MDKYTRLREDHLEARKAKHQVAINLLGTLKGEVDTALKGTDELPYVVVELLRKTFKNLKVTKTEQSRIELEILQPYLPTKLTRNEIINELKLLNIEEMSTFGEKMGAAMQVLRGRVDGAELRQIIITKF